MPVTDDDAGTARGRNRPFSSANVGNMNTKRKTKMPVDFGGIPYYPSKWQFEYNSLVTELEKLDQEYDIAYEGSERENAAEITEEDVTWELNRWNIVFNKNETDEMKKIAMEEIRKDIRADLEYRNLHSAALQAAGMRAEDKGMDINDILGRIVY